MTEAERYEKTVYRGPKKGDVNGKSSKKMSKQERWLQCVADTAETAPAELRPHFERMAMLDNVPFKPKQFRNFAMNSLPRGANVDEMWTILKSNFDKEMEKVNQNQGGSTAKKNEANADENEQQKEKEEEDKSEQKKEESKPKVEESDSADASVDAKKVKKTMKSILRKAKNRTMKAKKLRKDILKTLALKKAAEKKVEGIMTKHIESNPKKMVFSGDGKKITLVKKD